MYAKKGKTNERCDLVVQREMETWPLRAGLKPGERIRSYGRALVNSTRLPIHTGRVVPLALFNLQASQRPVHSNGRPDTDPHLLSEVADAFTHREIAEALLDFAGLNVEDIQPTTSTENQQTVPEESRGTA